MINDDREVIDATPTKDERNGPAFPRSERHESMVNSPQERLLMVTMMMLMVVVVMAVMTMMIVLHVRRITNFTTFSTNEGEGMDKSVINTRVGCGVDFDEGEPESLPDCVRETKRRDSEVDAGGARAPPGGGVLRARLMVHWRSDVRNVGVVGVVEA
jgi:hypothetical protein